MKRAALAIAVVLIAARYFQKTQPQKLEVQKDIEISASIVEPRPEAVSEPAEPSREPAMQSPTDIAIAKAIKEEVLELSERSKSYSELEDADQAWVIGAAAQSYAVGQIAHADLLQHIDELSEARKFEMYKRKEDLVEEPPEFKGIDPQEIQ